MRILVVSYWYAPAVSPRAFRWTSVTEHWAAAGHHVDVVTAGVAGLPRLQTRNGVRIHRTGVAGLNALRRAFAPVRAGEGSEGAPLGTAPSDPLVARLARLVHAATWQQFRWPDHACTWIPGALRKAGEIFRRDQPDAMITVSYPFSSHVVGLQLKRKSPSTRWIADVGDPFSFNEHAPVNNHRLFARLNLRAERAVVRSADATAVTVEGTRELYLTRFPESASKVHVIPHLLGGETDAVGYPFPSGDGVVRLVFVGTLYGATRNPDFLLRVFRRLSRLHGGETIELHFVGRTEESRDAFREYRDLEDKIHLHGPVLRATAWAMLRAADVLVNIGNETSYQLPSKVVDYASTGKPVLNFITSEDDSSARFFAGYPSVLNVVDRGPERDAEAAEQVARFVVDPPVVDHGQLDSWLQQFRTAAVAGAYEKLMLFGTGGSP